MSNKKMERNFTREIFTRLFDLKVFVEVRSMVNYVINRIDRS